MKKTFITIFSCLMCILALTMTGCSNNEKPNKDEEIKQAVSAAIDDTQIIPNSVSFGVQYLKSGVGAEENYKIIKSVSQLNDYIATEQQNIGLPIVLFKDEVVSKYNDEYFENSFIVIFMKAASSGSFDFRVNDVQVSRDRLIINCEIFLPGDYGDDEIVAVTCDMAYWYSFVELSNEYSTVNKVDLISLK